MSKFSRKIEIQKSMGEDQAFDINFSELQTYFLKLNQTTNKEGGFPC